jgi:hypothetical protein
MFSLVFCLQLVFFNIIHSLQQCSLVFLLWLQVVLLGNYALLNIENVTKPELPEFLSSKAEILTHVPQREADLLHLRHKVMPSEP